MTRRFWEGAVRGGYVGHGETYLPAPVGEAVMPAAAGSDDEVLWWAKGGVLHGSSPARIGFLERFLAEVPDGVLEPAASDWDVPWAQSPDATVRVAYFGFNRPRFRTVLLGDGDWTVDVVDTWNMTVERVAGTHTGTVRVDLPGRQYMALRVTRV